MGYNCGQGLCCSDWYRILSELSCLCELWNVPVTLPLSNSLFLKCRFYLMSGTWRVTKVSFMSLIPSLGVHCCSLLQICAVLSHLLFLYMLLRKWEVGAASIFLPSVLSSCKMTPHCFNSVEVHVGDIKVFYSCRYSLLYLSPLRISWHFELKQTSQHKTCWTNFQNSSCEKLHTSAFSQEWLLPLQPFLMRF